MNPEQIIRAKALELAVQAQVARGVSDPRQIMVLAEQYAAYIGDGGEAIPAEGGQ